MLRSTTSAYNVSAPVCKNFYQEFQIAHLGNVCKLDII